MMIADDRATFGPKTEILICRSSRRALGTGAALDLKTFSRRWVYSPSVRLTHVNICAFSVCHGNDVGAWVNDIWTRTVATPHLNASAVALFFGFLKNYIDIIFYKQNIMLIIIIIITKYNFRKLKKDYKMERINKL